MILEDVVVLSIAKPVNLSDGRISKCVIGYSNDLKELIRLYPTYHKSKKVVVGNILKLSVIRGDSRDYSFKLDNSKNLKRADRKIKVVGQLNWFNLRQLLNDLPKTTVKELNETKKSMGIIIPTKHEIRRKKGKPFLNYYDGKEHSQQILDNNFNTETYTNDNLALIVGNHHAYRNAFMVISAIPTEIQRMEE